MLYNFCDRLNLKIRLIDNFSCNKDDNKITVAEVTHSLFYAPMYVAKGKASFLKLV